MKARIELEACHRDIAPSRPPVQKLYNFGSQGSVVWKPVNANPWLKVNQGFHLAGLKLFLKANVNIMVETNVSQNRETKDLFGKTFLIGNKTLFKVHINPGLAQSD